MPAAGPVPALRPRRRGAPPGGRAGGLGLRDRLGRLGPRPTQSDSGPRWPARGAPAAPGCPRPPAAGISRGHGRTASAAGHSLAQPGLTAGDCRAARVRRHGGTGRSRAAGDAGSECTVTARVSRIPGPPLAGPGLMAKPRRIRRARDGPVQTGPV